MHGTAVALAGASAVIRGPSGSGKSDLALRFLFLPSDQLGARPALVADDQVVLRREHDRILVSAPPMLVGCIEVRGLGIIRVPFVRDAAEIKLLVDLDQSGDIPRFPERIERETLLGLQVPRIALHPFEASAPIKLALALQKSYGETVD